MSFRIYASLLVERVTLLHRHRVRIVRSRVLVGHIPLPEVGADRLRIALRGRPVAPAAAVPELEHRALREVQARVLAAKLLAHAVGPADRYAVRAPFEAALETPRPVLRALDHGGRVRVLEQPEV